MRKLSGKITICKTLGRDDKPINIDINDEISGCRLVNIRMSLEDFADALTGRGWVPVEMEVNLDGPIGMKAENKTEIVPFNCFSKDSESEKAISKALKPFEVDGWRARREDMTNGHWRTDQGQRVVFFRHVDPETGKPVIRD